MKRQGCALEPHCLQHHSSIISKTKNQPSSKSHSPADTCISFLKERWVPHHGQMRPGAKMTCILMLCNIILRQAPQGKHCNCMGTVFCTHWNTPAIQPYCFHRLHIERLTLTCVCVQETDTSSHDKAGFLTLQDHSNVEDDFLMSQMQRPRNHVKTVNGCASARITWRILEMWTLCNCKDYLEHTWDVAAEADTLWRPMNVTQMLGRNWKWSLNPWGPWPPAHNLWWKLILSISIKLSCWILCLNATWSCKLSLLIA